MATHGFAGQETHAHAAPQGFIRKWVFSLDHKIIGLQYYFLALAAVFVGMFLSLLMRIHMIWPTVALPLVGEIKPETYLSLVTMHGTIMVFFVLTTAPQGGFGNYFLPIQIGAPDMAFPVLNMLSFWTTFLGFIVMLAAFFVTGGAPLHGWTGYAPLSALPSAGPGEGLGADLWIISIAIFCIGALMGALNFITTTLDMRAKGMSMMRMPLTCWAWFITAILGLLAFGVLLSGGILLLMDRNLGTSFFVPLVTVNGQLTGHKGGSPLLWQHLFWFLGMPEEPKQVLPQKRRAALMACELAVDGDQRNKKAGAEVAVHQQQDSAGEQHSKREQAEDGRDEPGPASQRHPHHGHALRAHVKRGGDEVQRAHQRANAENRDADDPQVRAKPLAWSSRWQCAQWCVTGPAMQWRSSGDEESGEHHDEAQECCPERKHVQHRESHVRRADLNGQEVIAEPALRGRGEHEENHDGAVHRYQAEVSLRLDLAHQRQRHHGPDHVDAHQQREEHSDKYCRQRQEVILQADDFVVQTENPLADEALRGRMRVRFLASESVSSHVIASPPPVLPATYRILLC